MDISVVLVTFNRLNCLKTALAAFEQQVYQPKRLIIINNSSTDGTEDYLSDWKNKKTQFEKIVITTERNLGGAGGFATGLQKAIEYTDTDWIWLSDDDAYVKENTLYELKKTYYKDLKMKNVAALFTSVINKGKIDLDHRRRVEKRFSGVKFLPVAEEEYQNNYFQLAQGSYVGMLVKSDFVRNYGVTRDDFFIYYDDTEHCERLRQYGELYCVPASEIVHDVAIEAAISWKNYYGARNSTILIKNYYGNYAAWLNVIKRYIKDVSFLSHNSKRVKTMLKTGLLDGISGKVGLDEIYKPGWKAEK